MDVDERCRRLAGTRVRPINAQRAMLGTGSKGVLKGCYL